MKRTHTYTQVKEKTKKVHVPYTLRKTQPAISAVKISSSLMAGFLLIVIYIVGVRNAKIGDVL